MFDKTSIKLSLDFQTLKIEFMCIGAEKYFGKYHFLTWNQD